MILRGAKVLISEKVEAQIWKAWLLADTGFSERQKVALLPKPLGNQKIFCIFPTLGYTASVSLLFLHQMCVKNKVA